MGSPHVSFCQPYPSWDPTFQKDRFGRMPKPARCKRALPGSSLHVNFDRQQVIDHVSAAIGIAMHRLGSAERIGSADDERLLP